MRSGAPWQKRWVSPKPRATRASPRQKAACAIATSWLLLGRWLRTCNAEVTAEALQRLGVCAHVSWNMQDIARDPHLRARGATTEVSAPDLPPRIAVGAPARFSKTGDVGIRRLTPALGQDEDYVFGELLGLTA